MDDLDLDPRGELLDLMDDPPVDWLERRPEAPDRYWRFESMVTGGSEPRASIYLTEWTVVRRTPAGVWVDSYGLRKFVLDGARRRHAYPTKEEAWRSFLIRQDWRERHTARAHDSAVRVRHLALRHDHERKAEWWRAARAAAEARRAP